MNAIITQNHALHGYGYVREKGFVAFAHDVAEGPWADVDVAAMRLKGALLAGNGIAQVFDTGRDPGRGRRTSRWSSWTART